jgi:hypothetical protein
MPDRKIDLLFRFLQQEDHRLSKRTIENEFEGITQDEVAGVEAAYAGIFGSLGVK